MLVWIQGNAHYLEGSSLAILEVLVQRAMQIMKLDSELEFLSSFFHLMHSYI